MSGATKQADQQTDQQTEWTVDYSSVDFSMIDPMAMEETTSTSDVVDVLSDNSSFMSGFLDAFDEVNEGIQKVSNDGRISGAGAALFIQLVQPSWQVQTAQEGRTFDTAKVLKCVTLPSDAPPPKWCNSDAPNHLGSYGQVGNTGYFFYEGAWYNKDGAVTCTAYNNDTIVYFLLDYHAPREYSAKENQESRLLTEDGSTTLQYYLFKYVEGASAFINFFNPADNLIQGATGKNLNVFDPEKFGTDLTGGERVFQFIQAAAEIMQAKGLKGVEKGTSLAASKLHKAGQIALGISAATSTVGPVAIDILEKEGVISSGAAGTVRVIIQLAGMLDVFVKWRGGEALSLADYLTTLVTLQAAGDEAVKAMLGEKGYQEFWAKGGQWFTELTKNSKNIHDAIELLIDAEKAIAQASK